LLSQEKSLEELSIFAFLNDNALVLL